MASEIVQHDLQTLVEGWLKAEQEGNAHPVPFDIAWTIAGYGQKGHAKRKLTGKTSGLTEGKDYLSRSGEWLHSGRSSDSIVMSCDAFKHFCLMAGTAQGKENRQYFIECEKKWKLVQRHHPAIADNVEMMHLKIELAKIEAQKEQAIAQAKQADLQIVQFRHIVTTTMPEPIQQKVLGYSEVKVVEYRDRIIQGSDVINDGSTVNKTALCRRYGLMKRGRPDYKALGEFLSQLPSEAFELRAIVMDNNELLRDYLPDLDELVKGGDRNLYLGE